MQYEVPQFIDIKDKVFGPLTLNQFLFLAGGLAGAYLCVRFIFFPVNYILGIAMGIAGGYLGFGQYNGRPFVVMLQAMVQYLGRKKLYLWQFRNEVKHSATTQVAAQKAEEQNTIQTIMPQKQSSKVPEKVTTRQKLQDIAWGLDVLDKK